MKASRFLFIGIALGSIIGWALGFLRFPYAEKNTSFLLGFISCFAILLFFLVLQFIFRKKTHLINLSYSNRSGIIIVVILTVAVFITGFLFYRQHKLFEAKTREQNKKINEQLKQSESAMRSNLAILLQDVLNKVDNDLKNNPAGVLSEPTIDNIIAAFNHTFIPYSYWEGDSLSKKKLSREKGLLLIRLIEKNVDSISFKKIKQRASFSGADLRKANLQGIDLSRADLKDADLSGTDLTGANLFQVDLRNARMIGVLLNKSTLAGADLRRTDLNWAEINESKADSANFNGADLSNAQLRKTALKKATFRAGKLDGALLIESNMESVSLIDASLKKANLTKTNLLKSDVNRANFNEAIMIDSELNKILNIEKDWFKKLVQWHVNGANEIQNNYKIVVDAFIDEVPRYRLERN